MNVVEENFDDVMTAVLEPASEDLIREQQRIRDELKDAIQSGFGGRVMQLTRTLDGFKYSIRAATISETRKALDELPAQFEQLENEERELIALRKEQNEALQPILDLLNEAQTRLNETNFSLSLLKDQRQAWHEKRRDLKQKLNALVEEVNDEYIK